MTTAKFLLISLTIGCGLVSHAAAAPDIVPPGSKVELVARTQAAQATPFTEGPVYRDGHIYFTDTSNSRISAGPRRSASCFASAIGDLSGTHGACQWIGV